MRSYSLHAHPRAAFIAYYVITICRAHARSTTTPLHNSTSRCGSLATNARARVCQKPISTHLRSVKSRQQTRMQHAHAKCFANTAARRPSVRKCSMGNRVYQCMVCVADLLDLGVRRCAPNSLRSVRAPTRETITATAATATTARPYIHSLTQRLSTWPERRIYAYVIESAPNSRATPMNLRAAHSLSLAPWS